MSIDLAGVDLCATLTARQKADREISRERTNTVTVGGAPSPGCQWSGDESRSSYLVQIIEQPASLAWSAGESRLAVIDGFGAVREPDDLNNSSGSPAFCQLPLDVNDTQTLRVQYTGDYRRANGADSAAVDRSCAVATDLAHDVLGNLRRR